MSIPAVGLNLSCHSECVQCCPDKLNIFCCCFGATSESDADRPPRKRHFKKHNRRVAQPDVESDQKENPSKMQLVCYHTPAEHRTDAVAIAALKRHEEPPKSSCGPCVIL